MPTRQLKMVWDFRGPDAAMTAKHHEIHLKDFIKLENLPNFGTGVQDLSEMHSLAYLIINETEMVTVRDTLKPHRAFVHSN